MSADGSQRELGGLPHGCMMLLRRVHQIVIDEGVFDLHWRRLVLKGLQPSLTAQLDIHRSPHGQLWSDIVSLARLGVTDEHDPLTVWLETGAMLLHPRPAGRKLLRAAEELQQLFAAATEISKPRHLVAPLIRDVIADGVCKWRVKESDVLRGRLPPRRLGYYPVLVGLEAAQISKVKSGVMREVVRWSLASEWFDDDQSMFITPADGPGEASRLDIRHSAEVGIALMLVKREAHRLDQIESRLIEAQRKDGSWPVDPSALAGDAMTTTVVTEFLERRCQDRGSTREGGLAIECAYRFLAGASTMTGWSYVGLRGANWEAWGASIVAFRLGSWLPRSLKEHALEVLQDKLISSTDIPFVLRVRYVCGLERLGYRTGLIHELLREWHGLVRPEQDISTALHLWWLQSRQA